VARKSSDIALLLGSRGKVRSRGGFGGFGRWFDGVLGRFGGGRRRRSERDRPSTVSSFVFLIGVLMAFAGGFFVGGRLQQVAPDDNGGAQLRAQPRKPDFIHEVDVQPLAANAFIVSAYAGLEPADARARATKLANYLRGQELVKARPYEFPSQVGPLWVVAVYYDGRPEQDETARRLKALPEAVPDDIFRQLRKTEGEQWPKSFPIR
jgi:hypothetical protein